MTDEQPSPTTTTRTRRRLAGAGLGLGATVLACATPAVAGAASASPRVVGGANVSIESAPYQVALYDPRGSALQPNGSPQSGIFCGGVVLDATHIATAAHCSVASESTTAPRSLDSVRILAGSAHLRSSTEQPAATERDVAVSAISVNPSYNQQTSDSDNAVMTLAQPLYTGTPTIGSAAIAPVPLMSTAQTLAVGSAVRVSGWGDTNQQTDTSGAGTVVADLKAATTHLISSTQCASDYANVSGTSITPRVVCAGEPQGGVDSCAGDSGGPLTGTIGGQTILVGLVDFGVGCGQAQYPGVYSRIADAGNQAFLRSVAPGAQVSTAVDAVTPPATTPSTDTAKPVLSGLRRSCTRTRCLATVKVADAAPSSGIARVRGTLRWTTRSRGKTRRHARTISGRALSGGRYRLTAAKLGRRTYRLTITATDKRGNGQKKAVRTTLRPKR